MQRRLLYVITEDWFFRSHFAPMAGAAQRAGYEIFIACRVGAARADLEARGWRVLPLDGRRSDASFAAAIKEAAAVRRIIREHRIDLVHFIALRPILIGLALALAGTRPASVYALTGQGFLGVDPRPPARLLRAALRRLAPRLGKRSWFLFENRDDPAFLGLDPASPNVDILGGAGVDPDEWTPAPMPPGDPLRIAFVGRMLRFKGVADAVAAVTQMRAAGLAVELSLYGEPDGENPASVPRAELERWSALPGVAWRGRADDVRGVWTNHHVCVQPSHAAEGLPRAMLEAAAAGRAIVAADSPGCRDFVRDGVDGLLAPPGQPGRLAAALTRLALDRNLVEALGAAARRRIFDGFTTAAVTQKVLAVYELLRVKKYR